MSRRILCKYFAHGACLKGEYCEFSHDWKDQSNNVCTFYQKGVCSFGSRCRYDHVKVSRHQASASSSSSSSSSNSRPYVASDSAQINHPLIDALNGEFKPALSSSKELTASSKPFVPPGKPTWTQSFETHTFPENQGGHGPMSVSLADVPICSFAAAGSCPHGEKCPHIHGDLCSICGKHRLHPHRPDEREEHINLCQKNNKRLEALKLSQEIECSVCLDRVLSKPTAAERKFGLLSECDHPFCISCIRNWRSNSPASGMDVNNAVRACPICRKISYFVIPSVIWYSTKEEKQEIMDNYKAKLKSIDCKYFDFGNGTCPFGTSCFYRHTYKPHAKRPPNFRPCTYRPRQLVVAEEAIENLVRELVIEEELVDLARQLVIEEEVLRDLDTEDIGSLLGMSALLTQLGFDDWDSSSDNEN